MSKSSTSGPARSKRAAGGEIAAERCGGMGLRGRDERRKRPVVYDGNFTRYQGSVHIGVRNERTFCQQGWYRRIADSAPVPVICRGRGFFYSNKGGGADGGWLASGA